MAVIRANAEPDSASVTAGLAPEGGRIVVEARGMPAPVPLFFSVAADQTLRFGSAEIAGEIRLKIHVLQGRPEVLTLGLSGAGEVIDVSGAGLADWSVRRAVGQTGDARMLDLRPALAPGASAPRDLELVVHTLLKRPSVPGTVAVLIAGPGDAVGFASNLRLVPGADVDFRVTSVSGMAAVGDSEEPKGVVQFVSTGEGRIEVGLTQRGATVSDAALAGARLTGRVSAGGASVDFRLQGQFLSARTGARLRILTGRAALSAKASGEGWHVELVPAGENHFAYDLVSDRVGAIAVDLGFAAEVSSRGDWRTFDFGMPAGAVVPLELDGLGADVTFRPGSPIIPTATQAGWQGFLPSDGEASLSWKAARATEQGTLFYTSSEQTDVRVGAGLMRQSARMTFHILQGKLAGVRCRVEGPGEISVGDGGAPERCQLEDRTRGKGEGAGREVQPSRRSRRVAHGEQPAGARWISRERGADARLVPEGVVRHSGYVRVVNSGSVRLEVAGVSGMMQLAPEQFPGSATESGVRQAFVYRFPSEDYGYHVVATEIQAEVGVSQIATYELSETDRVIAASIELDIREASLRDWSVQIPEDYTVAALEGRDVSDYAAETSAKGGYRTHKVLYGRAGQGRLLQQLRHERNQPAVAGDWRQPPLRFPGAKSVRGNVGVVSSPGFRIVPARVDQLVEVPLSYFPKQAPGLQQTWRLRGADWSADVQVEALGQSVQADVFHLYSIKEGIVYGSVLLNYFVVGAPATEWRIEVPASMGNIDVVGQNVQRDWRREGNQVIVSLHQPVLGASTLLVTFEQPMSARGGTIEPGQVRPLGVQAERGYIEVVSPLQVKFDVRRAEGGLLKLDPMELPTEFRLLSASPALAVFQYTARPFKLEMGVEWYAQAETADQVVDFARLSSQVSRDGQVVTDAQYFVKTHGRKALRLILPPGVKLWETRVDNEGDKRTRSTENQTLIPLPARANRRTSHVNVTLRLGQGGGSLPGSTVSLSAPVTTAPAVITEWTLKGDSGLQLVPRGGTSSLVYPALTESGFEWISGRRRLAVAVLLGVTALGALFLISDSRHRIMAGLACCAASMLAASMLTAQALTNRRANLRELTYASSMVSPQEGVTIRVADVGEWRALIVGWGVAAAASGAALAVAAATPSLRSRRGFRPLVTAAAGAWLSHCQSPCLTPQHVWQTVPFLSPPACAAIFHAESFARGTIRWRRLTAGMQPSRAPRQWGCVRARRPHARSSPSLGSPACRWEPPLWSEPTPSRQWSRG